MSIFAGRGIIGCLKLRFYALDSQFETCDTKHVGTGYLFPESIRIVNQLVKLCRRTGYKKWIFPGKSR